MKERMGFVGGTVGFQRKNGLRVRCCRRQGLSRRSRRGVSCAAHSVDVSGQKTALEGDGVSLEAFEERCKSEPGINLVPVWRRAFSDQVTPVELYRRLVHEDDLEKTSYLLESVTTDGNVGRYSFIGVDPALEIIAKESDVTVIDSRGSEQQTSSFTLDDPWTHIKELSSAFKPAEVEKLPRAFSGGWVGYGGYDTARYAETGKLPFSSAPTDTHYLPDLHMSIFRKCITFDLKNKVCYLISWVDLREHASSEAAHQEAMKALNALVDVIKTDHPLSELQVGMVDLDTTAATNASSRLTSTMTKAEYMDGVNKCKWHIREGDAFQIVFSQRFERTTATDPFSVYRAMRIVNPSPYMIYMQCKDCILVASSPEILCRVEDGIVTNRPLAGTRPRGKTKEEDDMLEQSLLRDEKELAEHRMLVDLGRNDVGRIAAYGSVKPTELMEVEKYSHVMHLSSTVIGKLRDGLDCFDALQAALPVGTISGAPKIRAMQIIDDLEPTRRGPYGGGIGVVSFSGQMNIALALRTLVVPTRDRKPGDMWLYFLQAGAGIVADSDPETEFEETVNKAMALNRSIDLAEKAFH